MTTRLAPSPTGPLHLGHVRAYLAAWLWARAAGGRVVLRMEDLDAPRMMPGAAEQIVSDLTWLGLDWDEHAPNQSSRAPAYQAALEALSATQSVFACTHTRLDLLSLASAPHGPEGHPPYPAHWRTQPLAAAELDNPEGLDAAVRFMVPEGLVQFTDACQGPQQQNVLAEVGDFVLRRRDGVFAYQLACVVDDAAQGITHVVRGADLLLSTPRQILLHQALGTPVPHYAHVGLVVNAEGLKLSKRDGAVSIAQLRQAGTTPGQIVQWAASSLGLNAHASTPTGLIGQVPQPQTAGQQITAPKLIA